MTLVVKGNAKAKLDALARKLGTGGALKVGFLAGADYPDGMSVAMVAAIQNFGAPSRGIPPRPFFSGMIAKHQNEWAPALGKILAATQNDVPSSLALLGAQMVGQLQQSLLDGTWAPNSPVTDLLKDRFPVGGYAFSDVLAARRDVAAGASAPAGKPLVWSGFLQRSVDYTVNA